MPDKCLRLGGIGSEEKSLGEKILSKILIFYHSLRAQLKNIFMTVERINNKALLERVQKTHEIALKAAHSLIEEDVESQKRGDALALALFLHVPPVYLDLVLRGAHIAREEVVARAIR